MSSSLELNDLIGAIYEASQDQQLWVGVLRRVAEITKSSSASLLFRDLRFPQASFAFSHGIPDAAVKAYDETYFMLDPFYDLSAKIVPIGVASADHQMIPDRDELERICGRFYTEWMEPFDIYHIAGAHLFRDEHRAAALAVQRGKSMGPWAKGDIGIVTELVPHFQRAFRIHTEFTRLRMQANALYTILDQFVVGLALLAPSAKVTYVNPMARSVLEEHPAICLRAGRIRATDVVQAEILRRLINDAVHHKMGVVENRCGALGLRCADSPFPLPVLITPVESCELFHGALDDGARVAVFMSDPQRSQAISPDALATTYELTPAEAQVAIAIGNGLSPHETASIIGTAISTVRTQLKAIYRKMGVSRQSELVKVLLAGPFNLSS